jgi:hypothetical protein
LPDPTCCRVWRPFFSRKWHPRTHLCARCSSSLTMRRRQLEALLRAAPSAAALATPRGPSRHFPGFRRAASAACKRAPRRPPLPHCPGLGRRWGAVAGLRARWRQPTRTVWCGVVRGGVAWGGVVRGGTLCYALVLGARRDEGAA